MYEPQTDAELSLIGCLLVDPNLLPHIAAEITDKDLYLDESRALFNAALDLQREGKQIDVVTIVNQAGVTRDFAADCMDSMPTTVNWRSYLELTIEESRRRRAYALTMDLIDQLNFRSSIQTIQASAATLANALTETSDNGELDMKQAIMNFCNEKDHPKEYIKTGFPTLDRKTFIDKGDFVIIGGRPSAGKTAFAINLAMNMAKTYNVVFFSLETRNDKIMDRLLTAYSMLEFAKVKEHRLDEGDWNKFARSTSAASKLNFTVCNAAGRNSAWIQAKALKLKADIIFVDYIGLVNAEGKSRYEKVTNVSLALHTMSQQMGIIVIALSQLNRNGIGVPTMEDLRESGQIEQDADLIILLHDDKESGAYSVLVAKNKEGITGGIPFTFLKDYQAFTEISERTDEPPKYQAGGRKANATYRD